MIMMKISLTLFLVLSGSFLSTRASSTIGQLLDAINQNLGVFEEQYNKFENRFYEITEEGLSNLLNKLETILEEVADSFPITEALEAVVKLEQEAKDLGVDITSCTRNVDFGIQQLHERADTIIDLNKTYVLYINQWNSATNTDLNSIKSALKNYQNETNQCLKNLEQASIVKVCLLQVLSQLNMSVALLESQSEIAFNSASVYMEQMDTAVTGIFEERVQNWPEKVDNMVDYLSECAENIFNKNDTVISSFEY
ncbi:uncharacterized protein LOC126750679 isoform X2 [Anthonomus grandis grandis]|uniref:uncharacterized protein LOC126750679 isoform X2 n=1 Tax=Anthonomus grandis grandis TaxID=2921223 RepID=UPI0021653BDD|nr:uncharacterized protein LOC126750679 isoform X2 [Anthonomus grandis grandis]